MGSFGDASTFTYSYTDIWMYLGSCFKQWVEILPTTLQQCKELLLPTHLLLIEVIVLLPESPVLLLQLVAVVITHLHFILQYTQT